MKIVIAPDSFKGSLSALQAARAIARGLRRVLPAAHFQLVPVADGGEGTVDALLAAVGGRRITTTVCGPLGEPVAARWGLLREGMAVIEMAAASGLTLVSPTRRRPLGASTFGTGELISAALDRGVRQILLGIGGSASTDGGAGMAQALGVRLLDARGRPLRPGIGGGALQRVARVDGAGLDPRLATVELLVACDVNNPLVGPRGAAAVYGPQKGATPADVQMLDANLRHFGRLAGAFCGQPLLRLPGGGAAGGLGAGLLAFAGARLVAGGPTVLTWAGLERALAGADLVITGEGRLDSQTRFGKTPASVAALAARYGVPVLGLAGSLSDDANVNFKHGFAALSASVARPMSEAEAMRDAGRQLSRAAERLGHSLLLGQRLRLA